MKSYIFYLPLLLLVSCAGAESKEEIADTEPTVYGEDHEWVISAKRLKEKLGSLQASFTEIGGKEVEEIICPDDAIVPYTGNADEMNIWLMTTYMLDNFSVEEFGKHNFDMPDVMIKDEIPLAELNWLNMNVLDRQMFNIYGQYPDLKDIPRKIKDQDGMSFSNEETVQKADMVLKAIEDGLFAVIAITDYLPPTYVSETEFESGYVMGYLMFADWESGQLSCVSPLLATNSDEIDFTYSTDGLTDDKFSKEVIAMQADLQHETFKAIDSLAKLRTGFEGDVWVNYSVNLEKYRD
jgi:hypothetical protein